MKPSTKLWNWQRIESAREVERNQTAFLRTAPLPQSNPEAIRPTKCKVLRAAFCIHGKPVQIGQILIMPYIDAESLRATGKVEIIE
ncbi:MAG: hypothetical protein IT392_01140 [Nitrospirae bacterium]|nr:hypothetical protein [Nitrospirota bacterium]